MRSAFNAVTGQPWAIMPEWLDVIASIAQRTAAAPELVATRAGRPLENTRRVVMRDGVAVVPITGPIFPRANLLTDISGATSVQVLATDLQRAVDSEQVQVIVLDIDSPGGVSTGIGEMARLIFEARQRKRIIAYGGGLMASAAYWIGAAASDVVVHDTAVVGSIGVATAVAVQEQPNQAGVMNYEIVSSNAEDKRPDPRTEDGKDTVRRTLDSLEQVFVRDVAAYRGVTVETVLSDFGRGGVMVGQEAVDAGMADRLGSLEGLLAELAGRPGISTGRVATATRPASEETDMDFSTLTADQLAAERPDLVEALTGDAVAAAIATARTEGATSERERILGIEETCAGYGAHAELIAAAKADGKTTPDQAAASILAAERAKGAQRLEDMRADDPQDAPAPSGSDDPTADRPKDPKAIAVKARELVDAEAKAGRTLSVADAVARVAGPRKAA